MEVIELTWDDFFRLGINSHCFNSPEFIKQNSFKTENIKILAFKTNKVKMVIVFGINDEILRSPFSAPFGGFIPVSSNISVEDIDNVIIALIVWIKNNNVKIMMITNPPDIYDLSFNSRVQSSLIRNGFNLINFELNFHIDILEFNIDSYIKNLLWRNDRKNLSISLNSDLVFKRLEGEHRRVAYDVVLTNRNEKGYELKLKYSELIANSEFIEIDFFLIERYEVPIASAIVYKVNDNVVQVVYWGSILKYQDVKPINFLSLKLIEYYSKSGVEIIDIGPSSINSKPDYGLCNFKESIGCNVSLKNTFSFCV